MQEAKARQAKQRMSAGVDEAPNENKLIRDQNQQRAQQAIGSRLGSEEDNGFNSLGRDSNAGLLKHQGASPDRP